MSDKVSSGFIIDGLNLPNCMTGNKAPTKDQQGDSDAFMAYHSKDTTMTDNIINLCNKIQRRAMRCKRVVFHVNLNMDVKKISVSARPTDHNYMAPCDTWPAPLMNRAVHLNYADVEAELISVLDEMKGLGRNV